MAGRPLARETDISEPLPPRVQIVSRQHPHFEEYGRFTGLVITPKWGGADMAEVKLENCRHGSDGCFVTAGEVKRVAERDEPRRRRATRSQGAR